jgi:V-type H+-transporting ATPase proteolipid subunit
MGCSMAMVLSSLGAAYGIEKSGIGISAVSVMRPDLMARSTFLPFLIPIVDKD